MTLGYFSVLLFAFPLSASLHQWPIPIHSFLCH
jgi:hypothetical protein